LISNITKHLLFTTIIIRLDIQVKKN